MEDVDDDYVPVQANDFYRNSFRATSTYNSDNNTNTNTNMDMNTMIMSPEIKEIVEKSSTGKSFSSSTTTTSCRDQNDDVYVAVGKDDFDVVKWAIQHVVSPRSKLFLVHIYPPITYIPTPVGKLSRSQLTREQVRFYVEEEENKRKNLLQKYIRLCNDAKVDVDTVIIEHHATAKAIVDLIPFHNITILVIGMKKLPNSRLLRTRMAKSEYVKNCAPDFCQVNIVHDGKKYVEVEKVHSSQPTNRGISTHTRHSPRNLYLCGCFSACLR